MRSAVWEHFKKGKDDAECKHCGKTVKSKGGGNTTNLMAHLKTNHYMIYSSLQKRKEHSSMRSVQNEVSSTTTNETPRMNGQVVSSQRAQMKPDQANKLVFLAENL